MKFLFDENLSPRLCGFLAGEQDVAEHVRDALCSGVGDQAVLEHADENDAVIVTADTDFGTLIARGGRTRPSIILMRELLGLPVDEQGRLLVANLDQIRGALTRGAVVVLSSDTIRIRPLPILRRGPGSEPRRG